MREISPLDGRYAHVVGHLGEFFSEHALMQARCDVELAYLLALDETRLLPCLSRARRPAGNSMMSTSHQAIEKTTHDVKACKLFLRE
jgi:adenylosuccinate lyase